MIGYNRPYKPLPYFGCKQPKAKIWNDYPHGNICFLLAGFVLAECAALLLVTF